MISLSVHNCVAEVVLDAPQKLNSLDENTLAEMSQAYDDAAAAASRGEVGALLLRRVGRAFCAGRAMLADENLENTRTIVSNLAAYATGAFKVSKELLAHIWDQRLGLRTAMEEENARRARLCKTDDYAEGLRGFQEKRNP